MARRHIRRVGRYKSGLESDLAQQLTERGVGFRYEATPFSYQIEGRYRADFYLDNNVVIEGKGYFEDADRRKILAVRKAHPDLDLRIVFSDSSKKVRKNRPGTYADWCRKHGILFADKKIPTEWLRHD